MTAPSAPREQRPRVSAAEIASLLSAAEAYDRAGHDTQWVRYLLDLRDARAEIAQLREALATAERDGWIAGRDAAAKFVTKNHSGDLGRIIKARRPPNDRSLAPPATADGGSDG